MIGTDAEIFVDDSPAIELVDRSTLQRWAECPQQAWLIEKHKIATGGFDADSGNECHRIIAEAVKGRNVGEWPAKSVREFVQEMGMKSRPDLQPSVMGALDRGAWMVARLLCEHDNGVERSPADILHYDGGEAEKSGQVAWDIIGPSVASDHSWNSGDGVVSPTIRLTTELDLMLSTASDEEAEIIDWKSGWKSWTATDVKQSFQFQFQAGCVFMAHPRLQVIKTRVAMVRDGYCTSPVSFVRTKDLYPISQRMLSAVHQMIDSRKKENTAHVECWASPDKCALCPAVTRCHAANQEATEIAGDIERYLQRYVATDARATAMKKALTAKVREDGEDLIFPAAGLAFGTEKPKKERAASCDAYEIAKPKA